MPVYETHKSFVIPAAQAHCDACARPWSIPLPHTFTVILTNDTLPIYGMISGDAKTGRIDGLDLAKDALLAAIKEAGWIETTVFGKPMVICDSCAAKERER